MCRSLCSVSRSPALINAPQAVKWSPTTVDASHRSFGLWDCNNLDQPLRVTRPGVYRKVVGGSGFLFALRDFGEVVVMEAHSQVAVMSFQTTIAPSGSTPTITSQGQFVALVTSSHPRCGASSPARCVFSIRPLAESLWDAIAVSTTLDCVLVLGTHKSTHHVCFGLCRALSSVSRSPALVSVPPWARRWLTPSLFTHRRSSTGTAVTVQCLGTGETLSLLMPGDHHEALNGKWLVMREKRAAESTAPGPDCGICLSVRRLLHRGITPGVSDPVSVPISGVCRGVQLDFNRMDQDELLLISPIPSFVLTLIDVEASYQSKTAVSL
ncbi:hypothetical protein Pelo_18809 [Pelomyxa schiedti]|nr:hypothetical protein Pelo_18809 [Pelomyxa schiedti]